MKYTYFFIGLSLFLGSCSNKKVRPSDYYFQEQHPDTMQETFQIDSVIQENVKAPVSNSKQTPSPHYNRSPKDRITCVVLILCQKMTWMTTV